MHRPLAVFILVLVAACTSSPSLDAENRSVFTPAGSGPGSYPVPQESDAATSIQPTAGPPRPGAVLWQFKPGPMAEPPLWVSPLTSTNAWEDKVYVGASDVVGGKRGSVHALDARGGSLLWSFDHGGHTPSTPTVSGGAVYFGSEDHNVYAIDATSGGELWRVKTEGQVRCTPALDSGMVYVKSQDGYLYALQAENGSLQWRSQVDPPVSDLKSLGSAPPSPSANAEIVVAVGSGHILRAVDAKDGLLRWEYDVGSQVFGSPYAAESLVYVGTSSGDLYALDASDGRLMWSYRTDGAILSTPTLDANTLYASSGVVSALDARTGKLIWEYDPGLPGSLGSPSASVDGLYVAIPTGELFVLEKERGMLLARHDLGERIGTKPWAVWAGAMYVVTADRSLYGVQLMDAAEN